MTGHIFYNRMTSRGIDISQEDAIAWIDEFQKDIAADAGKAVRHTFSPVVANTEVALPTDFASVVEYIYNNEPYRRSHKVKITADNYIIFPEDLASIIMIYRRVPPDYTSLSTEVEAPALLQPLVDLYFMWRYYDLEGEGDAEESGMATKYMQRYEAKKNEILAKIRTPEQDGCVETDDVLYKRSRYHHTSLPDEEEWV